VVAIVVALLLVVLMAAIAMSVDVGGLYLRRRALVNGADAAALSAARTCARGGSDVRFASPEVAADREAEANAPITPAEDAGTNITAMTTCGQTWGHVSVRYTSQQSLFFAPVLGFSHTSPVTTGATASWGLGSNNPVPIVLSSLLSSGACHVPPAAPTPSIGQTCAFWYDNDSLGGGNFAFLSLQAAGWNVAPGANCNQSGGASTLTDWISGARPVSLSINWTDPTYVCSDSGLKGVGNNPNSQVWKALVDLKGVTRDFPINWEGPGAPVTGAPSQGTIWSNNSIDKYDIIGFAALRIVDVVTPNQAAGSTVSKTCSSKTGSSQTIPIGTYTWIQLGSTIGCPASKLPSSLPVTSVSAVSMGPLPQTSYSYDTTGVTLRAPIPPRSTVSFTWSTTTFGACGPPPPNNSAMCVITSWQGSTLSGDYQPSRDDITVVRLCDPAYGTCLDQ
jgi:hypothetical protein